MMILSVICQSASFVILLFPMIIVSDLSRLCSIGHLVYLQSTDFESAYHMSKQKYGVV